MDVRALRFRPGREPPHRCRLSAESATAFAHGTAGPRPVAFVLANDDLEAVLSAPALASRLRDRGTKHPAKGLKAHLLGRGPSPAIRGSYRSPGQLARSVRTLLGHAEETGEEEVYLVGADEALVESLWATARSARRAGPPAGPGPRGSAPPGAAADGPSELLDLLEPIEVPSELEARFVGHSHRAQLVRQLVLRAARTSEPVLIVGASGTGKEVVARSVHDFGERRAEPFIALNCAGIPSELLESELFGHERGAFTGATYKKPGLWKAAGRGTLFLDEIGDLARPHQAKLLRALQEGRVRPIGATEEVPVRARILAATNRDLYSMVRDGEFREDLYYRLRAFLIETPSLQDHPGDIPVLAARFWRGVTGRPGAALPPRLTRALAGRPWPGNARELRAVLANLHALFGADDLDLGHLGAVLRLHGYELGTSPPPRVRARMDRLLSRDVLLRLEDATRAARSVLTPLARRRLEPEQIDRVGRALERRVEELRSIASDVREDGSELGFDCEEMLRRVRGGIVALAAELELDPALARRTYRREVDPALADLLGCVQRRLEVVDQG